MKFLEYVVNDLTCRFDGKFQDVVVVLPTRRAGIFVRDYIGKLLDDRPSLMPQCTTIIDLIDDLCPLGVADEIKATCLLHKIFCNGETADLTLDAFYGWGRQLIADFNNIEKGAGEYTVESILQNSMEARHFDESKIDEQVRERIRGLFRNIDLPQGDDASFRQTYEKLWKRLPEIHRRLTEALRNQGCALEGARFRWVVEHFRELMAGQGAHARQLSGRTFVFVGFNRLLAVEMQLMQLMKEHGLALFYWDYDRAFDESEQNINVYKTVGKNIWRNAQKSEENLGGLYDDTHQHVIERIEVVAAPSDSAQARYVYDWLLMNHHDGERTAIVLCNENQLEHVVFAIPPQMADNVNITKGFPLRNTRIYAEIARRLHNRNEDKADFGAVLQSLLDYIDHRLQSAAPNGDEENELNALPWHTLLEVESLYQARCIVVRFMQLIEDGTLEEISEFRTLRNLLLRHFGTVSIPFHGEPITDIQIIGVLETRAIDFDNILFLNVEEGIIPKVGKDKSFIPYYLRKYYGLPTNDEQTEIFAYNFFRLLRCPRRVTILYSDAQTALGQKTMSRFVMQMLVSKRFNIVRRQLADSTALPEQLTSEQAYQRLLELQPRKCYADVLRQRIQAADTEFKKEKVLRLSPSAIKTFLTCPMKFYIRYLLGVPEPEIDDTLLQGNELGTLIHNSAEVAYKIITNNYTKPLSPEAIKAFRDNTAEMNRAIVEAFRMMNEDCRTKCDDAEEERYKPAEHRLEAQVAYRHLYKILENDERTPGLDIVTCECDAYYNVELRGLPLKIGGRIDRIDSLPYSDGNERVVRIADYKTGKYKKENMKAESIDELFEVGHTASGNFLQTLIYCLAVSEDVGMQKFIQKAVSFYPVLFYTQKSLGSFDPHLYLNEEKLVDFNAIKTLFKDKLTKLAEQILYTKQFPMCGTEDYVQMSGGTSKQGDTSPCKYCKYSLLCARGSDDSF